MNAPQVLVKLSAATGPYSAELLGLLSGVGAIAARDYGRGVTDILQSSAVIFGSISVIGLRHGVARVHQTVVHVSDRLN
jgi:hypothetical protein